jgi:hypothetical protein
MFDSSSAAQAVMDACTDAPIHINWATKLAAAATLRAAVDQVVPMTPKPNDTFCCPPVDSIIWKRVAKIRAKFLAIADELEGVKYGTYRCDLEKNE